MRAGALSISVLAGGLASLIGLTNPAVAAPPVGPLVVDGRLVATVAYEHAGQAYCYSNRGWRGAGWYVCGSCWKTGHGWGGRYGWNGWQGPAPSVPRSYAPNVSPSHSEPRRSYGRFSPPAF